MTEIYDAIEEIILSAIDSKSWKDNFPKENRYYEAQNGILYFNDSLEILKNMDSNSIDTVITDPPYGLSNHSEKLIKKTMTKWLQGEDDYIPKAKGFMGKSWDAFVPPPILWKEVYRIMKPGATALVFAGSRTQDLMAMSLRLSGFEIKDTLIWLYGTGFPKAYDIAKGIEGKKSFGSANWNDWNKLDGDLVDSKIGYSKLQHKQGYRNKDYSDKKHLENVKFHTKEANEWNGYKSHALKPAYEPIIMAIKPNDGSYVQNALKWGVSGLNIDDGRIETKDKLARPLNDANNNIFGKYSKFGNPTEPKGRFPANILLDEESAKMLDEQSGERPTSYRKNPSNSKGETGSPFDNTSRGMIPYNDKGGASRFFYVAKASKKERNQGLDKQKNNHPTVKPLKLMEYLVKLTKMPSEDQIYLDPFSGSGSTLIICEKLNRHWIGIEIDENYCEIAKERIQNNKV